MKVAWLSDIHLNLAKPLVVRELALELQENDAETILIGGDIAESDTVCKFLNQFAETIQKPIYFVLGNHDYYRDSISHVRMSISSLSAKSEWINWLPITRIVRLTDSTGLIGHGSWADGRLGSYMKSDMLLNDYFYIEDFNPSMNIPDGDRSRYISARPSNIWLTGHESKLNRLKTMMKLADEAEEHVSRVLPLALEDFDHVIFLTHVPPFKEACWHQGQISDDNALPHFSCKVVGDSIKKIMMDQPDKKLTVLCGHTHSGGKAQITNNIKAYTASAEYGSPCIQKEFNII